MGYLTSELLIFLLLAFLLGILIGYWIWGSLKARLADAEMQISKFASAPAPAKFDDSKLRADISQRDGTISDLEAKLAAMAAKPAPVHDDSALRGELSGAQTRIAELEAKLAEASTPEAEKAGASMLANVAAPTPEATAQLASSPFLSSAIGQPDDLQLIKGVGPKLNGLLNSLGVFHFFQIAGWSDADIDKVDGALKNFKGRIARDKWTEQAKLLASGDYQSFINRYGEMGENRK